jgi:hypothetical protein
MMAKKHDESETSTQEALLYASNSARMLRMKRKAAIVLRHSLPPLLVCHCDHQVYEERKELPGV